MPRRIWRALKTDLGKLEDAISKALKNTRTLGPGGRSILEDQYVNLGTTMSQKHMQLSRTHQQMMASQIFPSSRSADPTAAARAGSRSSRRKNASTSATSIT